MARLNPRATNASKPNFLFERFHLFGRRTVGVPRLCRDRIAPHEAGPALGAPSRAGLPALSASRSRLPAAPRSGASRTGLQRCRLRSSNRSDGCSGVSELLTCVKKREQGERCSCDTFTSPVAVVFTGAACPVRAALLAYLPCSAEQAACLVGLLKLAGKV